MPSAPTATTDPDIRPCAARRRGSLSEWSDRNFKWLLVAPATILILALSVYPLLFSIWVAFINYDFSVPGHAFVGLKNFRQVVVDPIAGWSLVVTAILSFSSVAIEFLLGLALALAMAKNFRGRGVIMSILIIPLFISPVIVGQAWALLLQRPFGPTNFMLSQLLGQDVTISWLTTTPWNFIAHHHRRRLAVDAVHVRHPARRPQRHPAAYLRGGRARRRRRLADVLVHHRPASRADDAAGLTFRLLDALKLFDTIFVMTGGGPGTSTYTASYYLYTIGFKQFHLSQATAGSWMFLVLTAIVIALLVRRLLKAEAA